MDPLSHALLGAVAARSLTRGAARPAMLAGALAAMLPDADVLIRAADDPLLTLELHRQFSHALASAPLGALPVAALVGWRSGERRFTTLYLAALAGFLSAILLDACTSYGTQLLWPFSTSRIAWSVIPVVEPVMTALLLAAALLGWRRGAAAPSRWLLAAAIAWLGAGAWQHARVEAVVRAEAAARGDAIDALTVKPTLGNLLLWRAVYRSGERYVVDAVRISAAGEARLYPGGTIARLDAAQAAPDIGAMQGTDLERFAAVSEGYLVRHPEHPDVVGDIRYAMLPDSLSPLWGIRFDPARPDGHVELVTFRDLPAAGRAHLLAMLSGRSR